MDKNFYCVIMAGGVGSRFWPISRNALPKQFLDILGIGKSFLQLTYDRFTKIVPKENIIVVTSAAYADLVQQHLPDLPSENILAEPYRRNTAPCIAYAATKIRHQNPNATMVVAPSDHYISNDSLFIDTISAAMKYASEKDELFTLGIDPTRPETGYGYIQCNMKQSKTIDGNIAYKVKTFTEKPNEDLAKVFVESGEFLWNSGIFVWNVSAICSALEKWLPEVYSLFKDGDAYYNTPKEQDFITRIYEDCPAISIDYGVMEKTSRAWVPGLVRMVRPGHMGVPVPPRRKGQQRQSDQMRRQPDRLHIRQCHHLPRERQTGSGQRYEGLSHHQHRRCSDDMPQGRSQVQGDHHGLGRQ